MWQLISTGDVDRTGGAVRAVVDAEPVAQQVDPGTGAHVDEGQGSVETGGEPGQPEADQGAAAAVVRLDVPGGEKGDHLVSVHPAQVQEERSRVGVRACAVDRGQRMVESVEQQVVDGTQQGKRHMGLGRGRPHRFEQVPVTGHGQGDTFVDGRVAGHCVSANHPHREASSSVGSLIVAVFAPAARGMRSGRRPGGTIVP